MKEIQFDAVNKTHSCECTALYCNAKRKIKFFNDPLYQDNLYSLIFAKESVLYIII